MDEKIVRGKWLTAFLFLSFLASLASSWLYLFTENTFELQYSSWVMCYFGVASALRAIAILAIWFWSKSGVVLYILLSVITIWVLLINGEMLAIFGGVVSSIILIVLIRKQWQFMDWKLLKQPTFKNAT